MTELARWLFRLAREIYRTIRKWLGYSPHTWG